MKCYVIMSCYNNPCFITHPKLKAVFQAKKDATKRCDELNAKATQNQYYVEPCSFTASGQ